MIALDKRSIWVKTPGDYEGVYIIADIVKRDLESVFDDKMQCVEYTDDSALLDKDINIVYGTVNKNSIIDSLLSKDVIKALSDKREVYSLSVKGNTLVIAGSDKRGTIYGLFELSRLCGVSPLVNFSGVLPKVRESVVIKDEALTISKEPSVEYRGIFINDEWPAFGTWATERFGGINAKCYAEVFEMILRLRGNYMWPAMWNSNFSMDGPGIESAILADKLGIVMSTSHHEPCMRTGEEYRLLRGKDSPYGDAWDFLSNREGITKFWEDGLKRNGRFENVITMGMRGERDTAIMAEASMADNIALLKDIIRTQNDLIRKYVNPNLDKVPRQLVLFTEVEKFYYGDENTPGLIDDPELDGITVMFSDNNHGYTRTLPTDKMLSHKGGYGMYYHVDMHGGAYSYEWIGSTYLPRILDQLRTTYDYGVRKIWVVNVGDIVSQELEISFIMDMAYDMDKYGTDNMNVTESFTRQWIKDQFGSYFDEEKMKDIFDIITTYTKILERRRHEIMNEKIYHPVHFGENYELIKMCDDVLAKCDKLYENCPERIKTGFYELVYYPAYGTCNLMKAWAVSTLNRFFVLENRNTANALNDVIDKCIKEDRRVVDTLHTIGNGKFVGQGLSEHFGFRFWNDNNNQLPLRVYCYPANNKRILISKKDEEWFLTGREYTQRTQTINDFLDPSVDSIVLEISCASIDEISYEIISDSKFLKFSKLNGTTNATDEIIVSIDRAKLNGCESSTVRISSAPDIFVDLIFNAQSYEYLKSKVYEGAEKNIDGPVFVGVKGYTVVEAEHYAQSFDTAKACIKVLKPYGMTGSAVKMFPNTYDASSDADKPYLEYLVYADSTKEYECEFVFAPSTPVTDELRQSFALRINDGEIIEKNTVMDTTRPFHNSAQWAIEASNNTKKARITVKLNKGINKLTYYQLSPNLILERFIISSELESIPQSYLGPKESFCFN